MEGETSTSHEANNAETTEVTRILKIYCCIPQCQSNTRKNPELSFHKLPKNPEILKKKWVQLLKRKGVRDPGPSQRVCSMHFVDGKKSYNDNTPTIFTTCTTSKPRKSPAVIKNNRYSACF
jgi:hypothetical protein